MLAKVTLIIVGILILVMGVLGAIPAIGLGTEPLWHAIVKIVVGLISIILGSVSKTS